MIKRMKEIYIFTHAHTAERYKFPCLFVCVYGCVLLRVCMGGCVVGYVGMGHVLLDACVWVRVLLSACTGAWCKEVCMGACC